MFHTDARIDQNHAREQSEHGVEQEGPGKLKARSSGTAEENRRIE